MVVAHTLAKLPVGARARERSIRSRKTRLVLAAECGVQAAVSRIVTVAGRDVLLVKRFDRRRTQTGYLRARMVSGLTLLRADELPNSRGRWSYLELVEALRRASSTAQRDAQELFRRACFNALISNTDDHPQNLLSQVPRFLLTTEQAMAIVNHVEAKARDGWHRVARRVGVTARDCEAISGAFCYPAFRLPIRVE